MASRSRATGPKGSGQGPDGSSRLCQDSFAEGLVVGGLPTYFPKVTFYLGKL